MIELYRYLCVVPLGLYMVWLKSVFYEFMDPFKIPHGLTKKIVIILIVLFKSRLVINDFLS